jgi:hypothetical protein
VEAANATGLFYAFQTLKKILPANVMAGVKAEGTYSWPVVTINDEPRFAYRGFMLDVSRHFFDIAEVKRMIDVMAYYKLNNFHWHLTDDQGWRFESKKYPKLNTVAATSPNSRFTDLATKTQYWINQPYGPYIYTQDEMREVVEYAAARHITVIPEIEFPGHMAAAITAYPELSCTPSGSHTVWSDGGISTDVLDVSNPKSLQFVEDILDEIMDVFPSKTIHIGGDECPTSAWQNSASCQALLEAQGYSNWYQLQSYFTAQVAEYLAQHGRTINVWNESITASGADTNLMKNTNATIYCWTGPDNAAAIGTSLGLNCIYTPWGPYYINRVQYPGDSPGAGDGSDTVEKTYNTVPFSTVATANLDKCYGVQGTFWCEHVSDASYLEYLALPRLIAIAEAGWTPQASKDFADFQKRITADTALLDLGGYLYGKHFLLNQDDSSDDDSTSSTNLPDPTKWYRLVTKATDARKGWCMELLPEGSSKIGTGNAQVDRLWSNTQAAEGDANYDYQFFQFREDPNQAGHYAIVCKAKPNGSVKSTPTATDNTGRWDYDNDNVNYAFTLNTTTYYGQNSDGTYYYAIKPDNADWYVNMAGAGQNYSVNLWSDPASGNGGLWSFTLAEGDEGEVEVVAHPEFATLESGHTYTFTNAVDGFDATALADNQSGTTLGHSADAWAPNAWEVTSVTVNADKSQTVQLRNAVTERYIAALGTSWTSRLGYTANVGTTAADVNIYRLSDDNQELNITIGGFSIWPEPASSSTTPSTIHAGSNTTQGSDAIRLMGAAWTVQEVKVINYNCVDTNGTELGTYTRSVPTTADATSLCPEIKNHALQSAVATDGNNVTATYKRTAVSVIYDCRDLRGGIIKQVEIVGEVGATHNVAAPEIEFYTFSSVNINTTSFPLTDDVTITATYTTEATNGVRRVADAVSEVADGRTYVIYDADPRGDGRNVYRYASDSNKVVGSSSVENASPAYAWVLEATTAGYAVRNLGNNLYIPAVGHGYVDAMTSTPASFVLTFDASTQGWTVQNASNSECWDGNSDGSMAGWTGGGQPYHFYEYEVLPFFTVTVTGVDTAGTTLFTSSEFVEAGTAYNLTVPTQTGYSVKNVEGNEGLTRVAANTEVTITYEAEKQSGVTNIDAIGASANGNTGIYDVMGRKLNHINRPGIYIINGQKVKM